MAEKNPFRDQRWKEVAKDTGLALWPPPAEARHAATLLVQIGNYYGISKRQRRQYLFFLTQRPDNIGALATILGLVEHDGETPASTARAGLEWLDAMLTNFHVEHLEKPLRVLIERGYNAIEICETFNDLGYDDKFNGRQPFGEHQIRAMAKAMGLRIASIPWQRR